MFVRVYAPANQWLFGMIAYLCHILQLAMLINLYLRQRRFLRIRQLLRFGWRLGRFLGAGGRGFFAGMRDF